MIIVTENKKLKESSEDSNWSNLVADFKYSKPESITIYYGVDSSITVSADNAKFIGSPDSIKVSRGTDFTFVLRKNAVMSMRLVRDTVSILIKNSNTRVDFSY
jgi:hypothetical protein